MVARFHVVVSCLLAAAACSGGGPPEPPALPIQPVDLVQSEYRNWLETSVQSPARAVARVELGDSVVLGPADSDVPLEGGARHVLVPVGGGAATLTGPDGSRTVPPHRPVTVSDHAVAILGDPAQPVVMVYAPAPASEPWGFYPVDSAMIFDVVLERGDPSPVRMLALDGIEVEGARVGTVTVPLGPEGTTLEVRSVPDPGTEEHGFEIYFRDDTNGVGSYPSGRFVPLIPLGNDRFHLDFNRARGPFCAYSTAYPCPVPWRGNVIAAPVEAGERYAGMDAPLPTEG